MKNAIILSSIMLCVQQPVLHSMSSLYEAVLRGENEHVRNLINIGAVVDLPDYAGRTLLYCAVSHGYETIVRILLENNYGRESVNQSENFLGWTPLHSAIENRNNVIVKLLIKNGADINKPDHDGNTPLHRAALCGHEMIVKRLLKKGANVNQPNKYGRIPLHCAVEYGHDPIVRLLLKKKSVVTWTDNSNISPSLLVYLLPGTMYEAYRGSYDAIINLLRYMQYQLRNAPEEMFTFCMAQHIQHGIDSSAYVLPT